MVIIISGVGTFRAGSTDTEGLPAQRVVEELAERIVAQLPDAVEEKPHHD